MPSLLAGLAACTAGGFFFLICGGIVAAIAIPNMLKSASATKAQTAEANLKALWAAEQAWAAAHDGEFLEFYVDEEEPTDENLRKLRVDLGTLHYAYEATYDGDGGLLITAIGNIDEDESSDEWEILSDDPIPFHVYDDIREKDFYRPEDEYVEEGGDDDEHAIGAVPGVLGSLSENGIGADGSNIGHAATGLGSTEVDAKSATARANLVAIWQGQQAYKLKKKKFMAFDKGGAATWAALGMGALPEAEHHTVAAAISGDSLTLTATANLDADAFEDEWVLSSGDGIAIQVKNDSLNLDLTELTNILKEISTKEAKKEGAQ